jgi:hypothetical protein
MLMVFNFPTLNVSDIDSFLSPQPRVLQRYCRPHGPCIVPSCMVACMAAHIAACMCAPVCHRPWHAPMCLPGTRQPLRPRSPAGQGYPPARFHPFRRVKARKKAAAGQRSRCSFGMELTSDGALRAADGSMCLARDHGDVWVQPVQMGWGTVQRGERSKSTHCR